MRLHCHPISLRLGNYHEAIASAMHTWDFAGPHNYGVDEPQRTAMGLERSSLRRVISVLF